jgi:hypothetical protein
MYDGEIFSMFIVDHLVPTPDHLWSLCTVPSSGQYIHVK